MQLIKGQFDQRTRNSTLQLPEYSFLMNNWIIFVIATKYHVISIREKFSRMKVFINET